MKILWGATRYGSMDRYGYRLSRTPNIIVYAEDVSTFRLWGVVCGDTFLGFMTRKRGRR
jgi:hypothetical protein